MVSIRCAEARESGASRFDACLLVNHKVGGGEAVHTGYVAVSMEHLRECVEKMAAFLLGRMKGNKSPV